MTPETPPADAARIHVRSTTSGDWEWLFLDGRVFRRGHSLSRNDWMELLRELGFQVTKDEFDYEAYEAELEARSEGV